jgi:hypothetical protein
MTEGIDLDIINNSMALSAIAWKSNLQKIEINSDKKRAILKNENGTLTIIPVNPSAVERSIKNLNWPEFSRIKDEEYENEDPYPSLGFLAKYEDHKDKVLTGNKLQVAKFYHEYLPLEEGMPTISPFHDITSGIKKPQYHKNLVQYLKELILIRKSINAPFDASKIKGALNLEHYYQHFEPEATGIDMTEEQLGGDIQHVQQQLVHLKEMPQLPSELSASKHKSLESVEITSIFSTLMSTCYRSIYQVDLTSYHSEMARRVSLRSLFKFQQAYIYMKEWVMKSASRSKGTKSSTQVRALLIGKSSIQNLLNINHEELRSFCIEYTREANIESSKKRKRNVIEENPLDLTINIPGFSGKISSRKLSTFIIAGPRLKELLEALNNNWAILDLVDDVTITWIENFRKEEWNEFIKKIET